MWRLARTTGTRRARLIRRLFGLASGQFANNRVIEAAKMIRLGFIGRRRHVLVIILWFGLCIVRSRLLSRMILLGRLRLFGMPKRFRGLRR